MDAFASFAESTVYNVGLQFSFRIFTFVLNAFLLRLLTKEVLGVANVRLMLLLTTLSFLVREPFRRACLQGKENTALESTENGLAKKPNEVSSFRSLVNVLWLCPILALPIGVLLTLVWTHLLTLPDPEIVSYYTISAICYSLSVLIETLAEPLWIIGQQCKFVRFKAVVEAFQVFLRNCIIGGILFLRPEWNLAAFAIAMLVSSCVYTTLYYCYFMRKIRENSVSEIELLPFESMQDLLPDFSQGFDKEILHLAASFWKHSLLKQLLTEGERYIMTVFNVLNFADQGVYDVIHNLGSLVARFFFAPLEESSYSFFSWTVKRGVKAENQNPENFEVATSVLLALLKLTSLVGLIFCVFGSAYSWLALQLYGGEILSTGNGPTLLRWYCVYVLLLALNGITECFCFATMRKDQIDRHQSFLVVFCVAFLVASLLFTQHYGSVGFLWANCINMALRIAYSLHYIRAFYRELPQVWPLWTLIPSLHMIFALLICYLFTTLSEVLFCCDGIANTVAHIFIGFLCLCGAVMTVNTTDKQLVDFIEVYVLKRKLKEE